MLRSSPREPDMTGLCRRLAGRYAQLGFAHPVAAAVAQAGRGGRAMTIEQYAQLIGVAVVELRRVEAGDVPLSELPAALVADLASQGSIDWASLQAQPRPVPGSEPVGYPEVGEDL